MSSHLMQDNYSHPTQDVLYCPENVAGPGEGGRLDQMLEGCDCTTDCSDHCLHLLKYGRNYEQGRLVSTARSYPILECNERCSCQPSRCSNRLVQLGPSPHLHIVRTTNKGRGLVTKARLKAGEFVCEYAGEILGAEAAKHRIQRQMEMNQSNYVMVVREMSGGELAEETIIDPTAVGNIGRYINHSCQPNLVMMPVRSSTRVPHLALFAATDIQENDELCFDYGDPGGASPLDEKLSTQSEDIEGRTPCCCASILCRRYLPFVSDLFHATIKSIEK